MEELQQLKTSAGSSPIRQEQESEAFAGALPYIHTVEDWKKTRLVYSR